MNDLLTPEQLEEIRARDVNANKHTGWQLTPVEMDRHLLLRDREAIAGRLEQIEGADCPNCDNSGCVVVMVTGSTAGCCGNALSDGSCCGNAVEVPCEEQEQQQCEWCYTVPWSRFNVRALITAIRVAKR